MNLNNATNNSLSTLTTLTTSIPADPADPANQLRSVSENESAELLLFFAETVRWQHTEQKTNDLPIKSHLITDNLISSISSVTDDSDTEGEADCDQKFSQQSSLIRPRQTYTRKQSYSCDFCDMTFKKNMDLIKHTKITHAEVKKPYFCDKCCRSYTSKYYLKQHRCVPRSHEELLILEHNKTHLKKKSYTCVTCGNSFQFVSKLLIHKRAHSEEKSYPCKSCKKSFSQQSSLTLHGRIHTGEKPYRCNKCSYAATQRIHLKRHTQTAHHTVKPYICDRCGQGYTMKRSLYHHKCVTRSRNERLESEQQLVESQSQTSTVPLIENP